MKKIISITTVLLLLLAGMHFTIALHYCGGNLATTKASFSHETGGCGMEMSCETEKSSPVLNQACCHDEISSLTTDDNYSPSVLKPLQPQFHLLQSFYIPQDIRMITSQNPIARNTNVFPPGDLWQPDEVGLSFICVYLI